MRPWAVMMAIWMVVAAVPGHAEAGVQRRAAEVASQSVRATIADGVVVPTGPQSWPLGVGLGDGEVSADDARVAAAASLVRLGAPDEVFRYAQESATGQRPGDGLRVCGRSGRFRP